MSTLKTNTLSNAAGTKSVPVDTVVSGSAKAWVNFNGIGTVAIRAAFNVTSITDTGVGAYTVNFTQSLPDTNYSILASVGVTAGVAVMARNTNRTSSAAQISITNSGTTDYDTDAVLVAVFR